jgi:hypothetical protein
LKLLVILVALMAPPQPQTLLMVVAVHPVLLSEALLLVWSQWSLLWAFWSTSVVREPLPGLQAKAKIRQMAPALRTLSLDQWLWPLRRALRLHLLIIQRLSLGSSNSSRRE